MKKVITLFLGFTAFLVSTVKAQSYMLLDRVVHKKVTVTDSVTRQNLSDGYFPIYSTELDSLIQLIENFSDLKKDGLNRKYFNSDDYKSGHLTCQIESIKRTYGDGYDINIISSGPWGKTVLKVSDARFLFNQNQKNINQILSYLKARKKEVDKGEVIKQ